MTIVREMSSILFISAHPVRKRPQLFCQSVFFTAALTAFYAFGHLYVIRVSVLRTQVISVIFP